MTDLLDFSYVTKRDYRSDPFRRVVVLGESHVAEGTWVNVFGALLTGFQGPPRPEVINAGIGANVISRRSPGYAASAKPSALERFRDDVIGPGPDLVIISYGLNDMRAGMPAEDFREDLAHLAGEIRRALDPVIVLTTVYNMSAYALYPPFDKGSPDASSVSARAASITGAPSSSLPLAIKVTSGTVTKSSSPFHLDWQDTSNPSF